MPFPERHPIRCLKVGEVSYVPERRNMANYVYKRGVYLGRKFRTRREGDKRRVERIA